MVYGFLSHLSLALASAVVCHCMFEGSSAPPSANAFLWSMTYRPVRQSICPSSTYNQSSCIVTPMCRDSPEGLQPKA
jgi:hypothetical protein